MHDVEDYINNQKSNSRPSINHNINTKLLNNNVENTIHTSNSISLSNKSNSKNNYFWSRYFIRHFSKIHRGNIT